MNYLAHAWSFLRNGSADPYELAGVAVPDWLGVASRRTKCRSRDAAPHLDSENAQLAALARGVCRHHADDAWFHESPAFGALSLGFAKTVREALGESTSMRPWFLGHILVEMLLDDELARREPGLLDWYYELMTHVDGAWVAASIERMAQRDVGDLALFVERYVEVRFLADYRDDDALVMRLNQVMQRVRLDKLPAAFTPLLAGFRGAVAASFDELVVDPDLVGKTPVALETGGSVSA
ncbi:hypothetical protein [Botrimarina mediterranea]|uniref:Acyl carrier protein phosphodiesterase n=1 Tax=Botrimarina mediterranea TaxID=2528022 RepID=A0A518K406_9BACT|nr:hypothetical protein [Botrimarina mediterranea]QDV72531.1 hypothetical protein Spa11_07090 [Botrimarina mediterranea]